MRHSEVLSARRAQMRPLILILAPTHAPRDPRPV